MFPEWHGVMQKQPICRDNSVSFVGILRCASMDTLRKRYFGKVPARIKEVLSSCAVDGWSPAVIDIDTLVALKKEKTWGVRLPVVRPRTLKRHGHSHKVSSPFNQVGSYSSPALRGGGNMRPGNSLPLRSPH